MSYSDSVETAASVISQQTGLMNRCLGQNKLMEALQHCSVMLTELRNPNLTPKQYYELYVMIFDSLSVLSTYLVENHPKYHHLADLYELVQYTGNVVPRLYLMITVGTSYLRIPDAPVIEILKDMIEMCRGVQNPIRGLFLRYYLSQRTKELLPDDELEFNANFIMNNFIEMNKLWVRLQHQGPLRKRELRTKERKELQILVGSQLVRLSQIIDDNFDMYDKQILPTILEQVVQCRDFVSQEYLMDVICQVFSDEFHLQTASTLLKTTLQLNPDVSMNKIVLILIERLNSFKRRKVEEENEKQKQASEIKDKNEHGTVENGSSANGESSKTNEKEIPDINSKPLPDVDIFDVFANYLELLNKERPDLSLQQFIPLIESVIKLTLQWYPDNLKNINRLFTFTAQKYKDYGKMIPKDIDTLMIKLLTFENSTCEGNERDSFFFYRILTECDSFPELLGLQSVETQRVAISEILDYLTINITDDIEVKTNISTPLSTTADSSDITPQGKLFIINTKSELEKLLSLSDSLIHKTDKVNKRTSTEGNDQLGAGALPDDDFEYDIVEEKLARFCHIICKSLTLSPTLNSVESQIECYLTMKNHYYKAGKKCLYTYPAIITNFWKLVRRCNIMLKEGQQKEEERKTIENNIKQIFKFISRAMNDMFNVCGPIAYDTVYKMNLECAALADQLSLSEISYDFFSQAFTIYEESINDSKDQFQAILLMTQTLQKTRSLHKEDYYDSLIVRCTLHGSKLLKKQDQCRSVYLCSHMWWATELSAIGEEEGVTTNFFREGKRVLECLQRALRVSDSIMDNVQSCELMIEILNRCLYYFIHGNEKDTHITVKYINGLIELIKTNIKALQTEAESYMSDDPSHEISHLESAVSQLKMQDYVMGLDGSLVQVSNGMNSPTREATVKATLQIPIQHFARTCSYIREQGAIDERFQVIEL
ncbi:Vacuolar protein sorting-associated protein 35 [Nakaseomyces glabratus]|uniref:Vacuolar protein sorting-associated protein 35 n=1 Tax=Candida glabrata TaxID=5478 RepID=A0A0W0CKF2_CANGB|nr:Vacuolar protein sorting-associated protein 35 [Nakaseomyces glabratus]KTB00283.1 Vacuolar protein sorting-associated protein 35 [Nakaseomyces glabratus]KTB05448.1 Vacuolar protein sorting-associated protein 35 [Nakaseomyces glabratus]KTB13179.1 Vacuolar protein sorting-associated protein 35 [Nakaseomyces glabratus]